MAKFEKMVSVCPIKSIKVIILIWWFNLEIDALCIASNIVFKVDSVVFSVRRGEAQTRLSLT